MCTIDSDSKIDIEKHFKVEAGPGAGKTRWLIHHINNVLADSNRLTCVNNIACITYTNIAVDEIKSRLNNRDGRVEVSTIHSFLYKNLVKSYAYLLKDNEGNLIPFNMKKLDGHDEHQPNTKIIQEWLNACDGNNSYLIFNSDNAPKTKKILSNLVYKIENDEIVLKISMNNIAIATEIKFPSRRIKSNDFFTYKRMYWKDGTIDHEDVLFISHELLRQNPVLIEILRAKYPYIFLDEFQDTNPIQTAIIKMLASEKCIIGVIGDYNQSIYGFQGANPADFKEFNLLGIMEYRIKDNWRCTQKIIDCLNAFDTDSQQLCCREEEGVKPIIIVSDIKKSLSYIKAKEELKEDNTDFTSIILTKANENLRKLKMEVNAIENVSSENKWDIFQNKESNNKDRYFLIKRLLKAYQFAIDKKFELAINEILLLFKKKPLNKIVDKLKQRSISLELLEYFVNNENFKDLTVKEFYSTLLNKLNTYDISESKYGTSGAASIFAQENKVQVMLEHLKISDYKTELVTIHGAKGTEYNIVTLYVFDDQSKAENKVKNCLLDATMTNEEHRKKFVAMSRAKDYLYIVISELSKKTEKQILDKGLYEIKRL